MSGVADIDPVDDRDVLDGFVGDLLQLFLIRLHRDHLHHEVSLHVLIFGELLYIHLRDLFQGLIQTGKELAHHSRQAFRVLHYLVMKLMQVHGDSGILSFRPDREANIGLSLQLFHLLDRHIGFRVAGLRSILCDIKEIFITHRHSRVPP